MSDGTCSEVGCGRPVKARGLCGRCYQRLTKSGALKKIPVWHPVVATSPIPIIYGSPVLPDRIWRHIEEMPDGRWRWAGSLNDQGYAVVSVAIPGRGTTMRPLHALVYEAFVGPVPEGHIVGHACHDADLSCAGGPTCPHRAHCHPACLETMTPAKNKLRGRGKPKTTHCPRGHEYTAENTHYPLNAGKVCRACHRVRSTAYYRAKTAGRKTLTRGLFAQQEGRETTPIPLEVDHAGS